ncbi:PrsW family intramembrane metalloprotease [Listeria monocytogenes]|uniref:PrsW family glutamic-type intramembrane protease n=1 Tax=Listeria monocytogenes TaxID=1639 RepID=UPI000E6D0B00|nr:PrsW family glutamic-type intramembrane protease [Listeria monocytogenes]NVT75149.1 PrsW family intramembrane metalloprotease [Listeria monocytogenes]RJB51711.1 PrsW family intramembrane metalloprotease [Listeria monocytogenes]
MSEWYFKKNEQKMGPFTNVEMIALYRKKEINNLTLVQKSPHPEWIAFKQTELYQHIGNHGNSELKISNLFSAVFKKHSKEEGEKVFIAGTKYTTPAISDIPHSWPHPWVFSRVFLVLIVTYFLLLACTYLFDNSNTIPGLMVIGSFAVPFSVLLFFFETNAPRNISVFDVVRMFFIGGVAALVATLVIYSIIPVGKLNYFNALLVGFIEETGKMIIVALFIRSLNSKYILNGLLIGAAVGAGFAAFESLGYAFNYSVDAAFLFKGIHIAGETMLNVIFSRGWQSIGGHVAWAAITGAALVIAKGDQKLGMHHIFTGTFWKWFIIPIALHFIWDCPFNPLPAIAFKQIVLIIVVWFVILRLISKGLKQVSVISAASKAAK